jgi:TRAP-type C4-dicarboxylate transport system substrate-binding protein
MMQNRLHFAARAAAAVFACAFVGLASAQTKWDMPTAYPPSNYHTENIQQFVADVDKATGGKLKITVHNNASLFKATEIKRAVQSGQAQVGEILISNYANEDPLYGIDSVPFLATSFSDAEKLWKASRKTIEEHFAKQGLKVLYAVPWPPQGIYVKKDLNSIDDLKGAKWRAYNAGTARIAELVGAQAVTIQAAELPQALATGVVNAFMTSSATGYDSKAWESMSHYYDTQAWLPKNVVIANKAAFDKLDKATQDAVLKAAAQAEERGWKMSQDKNAWYVDKLKSHSMKVAPPGDALKAGLATIGDQLTADWIKRAGSDGQAVIDAYKKM